MVRQPLVENLHDPVENPGSAAATTPSGRRGRDRL